MFKVINKKVIIIIAWALIISWMLFIFNMSSRVSEDSDEISLTITNEVVKVIEKVSPNTQIDVEEFNHIIRKNAHFWGYLLLGMLAFQALRLNGVSGTKLYLYSFLFCVLYAISDEIHQNFVAGRGPQVLDVIIDSSGATIGIMIFGGIYYLKSWLMKNRKI